VRGAAGPAPHQGGDVKEVYVLRRLQATDDSESSGLGLHFDLTGAAGTLRSGERRQAGLPVRRYQIQRCWRGERPQEGRYREFTQADIDIVGRDQLPFDSDVEVAEVMAHALSRLRCRR
jgi:histidyl-tRNA synthetase